MRTPKVFRVVLAASSFALAGHVEAEAPFMARQDDQSVQQLVARWAAGDGKAMRWEALSNVPIKNAGYLNATAKLADVTSFSQALDRLNNLLEEEASSPLEACSSKDFVVIRTVDQNACGVPLN